MSQEAQARFFLQYFVAIKEVNIAGSFISAFADWKGDRPLLNYGLTDCYVHPVGLLSATREKRLAYDIVRSLFNDERISAMLAGNYRAQFPFANVLTGLLVIILIGYMYSIRRFGDSLKRSILRSYNFFVDLRNLHTVSILHTLILAFIISITLADLLSSILLHYRGDAFIDYILSYFFVIDLLKEQVIYVAWNPVAGIAALTGLFFFCGILLALLFKVVALLVRVRVSWFHVYSVSVWGATPLIFLSPLAMSLFKIMQNPSFALPSIILILLFLIWIFLRMLKAISIIYDFRPVKTYIGGILLCFIVLGGLFLFYDSVYALSSYMKFIAHLMLNIS